MHLAVALGAVVVEGATLKALRDDRVEREPDEGESVRVRQWYTGEGG